MIDIWKEMTVTPGIHVKRCAQCPCRDAADAIRTPGGARVDDAALAEIRIRAG